MSIPRFFQRNDIFFYRENGNHFVANGISAVLADGMEHRLRGNNLPIKMDTILRFVSSSKVLPKAFQTKRNEVLFSRMNSSKDFTFECLGTKLYFRNAYKSWMTNMEKNSVRKERILQLSKKTSARSQRYVLMAASHR